MWKVNNGPYLKIDQVTDIFHKESTTGRIELEEDDVTAVEAMLRFMYHFDYSNIHGASTMVFNAQVYGLADKYAIPALKSHACETFRAAIVSGWATEDIPSAVAEVYNSTPESDRGLRDQIVEVANANIGKLLETWSFRDMLKETPCFALDMAVSLSGSNENRHQKLESYKCPSCGTIMHGNFADGNYYYCVNCAARYANWTSYVVKS